MMKKYVKEIVYYTDSEYGMPEKVEEFMEYWQTKINLVPEEFRDSTRICIDADDDGYGCNQLEVQVYYMRPETEEEETKRITEKLESTTRIRDRDLAQYEKLKAKYDL